jgi:hypothetical protein
MPYFSGTYPSFVSNTFPGVSQGGQDYVAQNVTSAAIQSGVANIATSRTFHNYAGAATYVITNSTPVTFKVYDAFGAAAANNITVSGLNCTINGASTAVISTNYGVKEFTKVTGGNTAAGSAWIAQ